MLPDSIGKQGRPTSTNQPDAAGGPATIRERGRPECGADPPAARSGHLSKRWVRSLCVCACVSASLTVLLQRSGVLPPPAGRGLYDEPYLSQAIFRYQAIWLPLFAEAAQLLGSHEHRLAISWCMVLPMFWLSLLSHYSGHKITQLTKN